MNRLLVVRHGQTAWNIEGRIQGSSDIDLDETGRAQVVEAAPELAEYEPTRIISSDLRRAVDTARPVAELTGIEIELDKRLRERAYGPWEGLTQFEIAEQFPEDHRRWRSQEPLQHPEIETWAELHRRTGDAVRDIVSSEVEGTAIVVCHGGSARQIIGGILGWDETSTSTLSGMDNAHWAELRRMRSGKWRMFGYNLGVPAPHTIGSTALARGQQARG
ncbi:histidine phosphatase family protein [Glycomyces sp. TRM65418]|uniref:histidine phosphatase family protein n=1 Tax=Glycomyces sp. TRM65418 TaxID=2867006 RepID=UPI001CE55D74|nr:histidine phosphatase family protein [Glycomyces sp. TRM65418]MCC3765825.1 histidine phosphatase family protein [Glycomyces sp. TRM65418]QZD55411.1 histidine phosphatase family protein [Glycomyces sp. TRM65418]